MTQQHDFPDEWRPFFAAIVADPHNDAPKLIFADYLDEAGNALGEEIRLYLKQNKVHRDSPEAHRLRERTRANSNQVDRFWRDTSESGTLQVHSPVVTNSLYLSVEKLLKYGEWIAAHVPAPRIDITIEDNGACLQQFDRRLGFERWKFTFKQRPNIEVVLQAMQRERFREFDLQIWGGGNGVSDADYEAISQCESFRGVESFDVSGPEVTDEGFRFILHSPLFANIKKINLNATKIGNASVVELANSHWPAQLEELGLWLTQATDESFRVFANCDLSQLKKLDIGAKSPRHITERGFGAFTHNQSLTQLAELNLGDNEHSQQMIEELAGNERFGSLRRLNLTRSLFDDDMANALAASPYLRNLHHLQIFGFGAPLTMKGFSTLVSSPIMQSVTDLTLGVKAPGERVQGCQAIADSPHLRELRRLSLMLGQIEDAGVQAIAESTNLPELETLSLPDISESAALAIGESKTLGKLKCLLANIEDFSPEARATLVERFGNDDLHIRRPRPR